jgi:hypothetical protein
VPKLFDQHRHAWWQSVGLACQADTQPIPYFLADSGAANAVDLNVIPNSWAGQERVKLRGQHRQGEAQFSRRYPAATSQKDPARTV